MNKLLKNSIVIIVLLLVYSFISNFGDSDGLKLAC
jgi:hypothetical protein